MTTPTATRKICVFFFTGPDRSRLTNLDRSRFEKELLAAGLTGMLPGRPRVIGRPGAVAIAVAVATACLRMGTAAAVHQRERERWIGPQPSRSVLI